MTTLFSRLPIWAAALILIGITAPAMKVLAYLLRRWINFKQGRSKPTASDDNKIDPQPAVIAFVSKPKDANDRKSHENAVEGHLGLRGEPRRDHVYVRLIASPESGPAAEAFKKKIESGDGAQGVNIDVVPQLVDFKDIKAVYDVTAKTIVRTLEDNPGLMPDQIVLDITGGRALTSVGAALAGRDHGVRLEYIESPSKDGKIQPGLQDATFLRVSFDYHTDNTVTRSVRRRPRRKLPSPGNSSDAANNPRERPVANS